MNKGSCSINTAGLKLPPAGPNTLPWDEDNTSLAGAWLQNNPFPLSPVGLFFHWRISIYFMSSTAITLSHWGLVVEDFGFQIPQAALQVGAGFWLQGLRELDVIRAVSLRLSLDGVLDGLWGEVVNDRVKAAVGHSDAERYWVNGPHHWLHIASF